MISTDPNNPEVVSKTIIDGNDAGLVITFTGLGGPKAVLSDLTITNGYANYGGGIYCFNNSSPTISNCIITGNSAEYGGGIACVPGNPVITNCAVTNNWANYRGGIAHVHSSPIMINYILWNNDASMITISYSDVYGGWPGDDNIDDEPLLEPDGYHLMPDSPCINMGTPSAIITTK